MKKVIRIGVNICYPLRLNLKMRITSILLLVSLFQLNANESYSQKTKVTFSYNNVSLETVFNKIESQTEFKFIYKDKEINYNKTVSIKAKKEALSKVLKKLFSNSKITYSVTRKQIILKPLKTESIKNIPDKIVPKIKISGAVTDEMGNVLPGASILEKGTTNGTETDFDGNFILEVNDEKSILVISYLGYAVKEILVGKKTSFSVVLKEDAAALEEIVIIGYGSLSRSKVLGAITSIGSEDISQLPVNGIGDAIAGRVAGVHILSNGAPGAGSAINIRGIGTLTAGSSPLIVVDGYQLSEGSDISAINPTDIESMSVLKDGASVAIYGSRGASGVIMITTKKAKSDKTIFDFNTYSGFQDVLNEPEFMNAYQFAEVIKEARDWGYVSADPSNRSANDSNATRASQGAVSRHLIPSNFDKYLSGTPGLTDNNWLDDLFRRARIESYDVSVSGRSGTTNWYISGGYFNQEGLIVGSGFKRYIARINLETKFNDKVKFGINLSPSITKTNSVTEGWTDSPMQQAILSEPFFTPYNDEGELNISQQIRWHNNGGTDGALAENPIAIALRKKDEKNKFRLFGSTFLEYKIIEDLTFKTLLGGDFDYSLREQFRPSTIGSYRNDVSTVQTSASERSKLRKNIISENTLTFSKEFNKHSLNALAGYSYQTETSDNTYVGKSDISNNNITNVAGQSEIFGQSKSKGEWVKISYFGRIQYDYDSRYLFSTSTRSDGSSRFGSDTKFGNFSSFSGGWIVSNEDFFPEESFLSKLKLRYSWGQSGNDQIPNFASIAVLKELNGFIDGGLALGQIPDTSPNADLQWETSVTSNIGFDLGLFDNKVNLVVDYFIAKTKDMLLDVPVPLQSGFARSTQNVGTMENKGLEIVLSTSNINLGAVNWNASINFSTVDNKVTALGPGQTEIIDGAHITKIGSSVGELFGYQVDGIYKSQSEIDASPQSGTDVRVGDWRILDTSEDGIINDDDRESLGATIPDFTYGFNNRFSYKNFDLNVFVDGVQGVNVLSRTVRNASNGQGFSNQFVSYYEDRWHPTNNPNGTLARPDYTQSSERLRANISSAFIEDGSFFRVRNITLGYSIPANLLPKTGLSKLRIYATAKNPFISTSFKGFNPQQRNNGNALAPSDTQGTYPLNKSFVLGLNVSF